MKTMKKILVTGASGFVGGRIVRDLKEQFQIIAPTHGELDITSAESARKFIDATSPDAILHLAAISDTGYCENNPQESYLVNVIGVENLAAAAAEHNTKIVFFSSDQIYNGNHELGPLSEEIPVQPENHYGRHKLLAEEKALAILDSCVALRATWMYDAQTDGMRTHNNFVINIANAIKTGTPLRFATREFRGITWIEDVVKNIPHTFDLPGGVYNFGAENTHNTYETACQYVKMQGHNPDEFIIPDTQRFSEHIRNISISTHKIRHASNGKISFMDTLEGLERYLGK